MEHKTLLMNDCEIKVASDNGQFEGYASTFDNVDSYGDTILAGAYKETLATHGLPKMFISHKSYELPIGKWLDASEDSKGLYVKGELTPNLSLSNDVHAAMKHQTLDGLSIGYALKRADYEPSKEIEGGRIIKKVSMLSEISPVTFPADSFARIESVKSELEQIETIRDLERCLRDVCGCSKEMAKMIISKSKTVLTQRDAGNAVDMKEVSAQLLERLNKINL